jgi:hypothetical protein
MPYLRAHFDLLRYVSSSNVVLYFLPEGASLIPAHTAVALQCNLLACLQL